MARIQIETLKGFAQKVWDLMDGLYGGDGSGWCPYDDLPPDRQKLADDVLDSLGHLMHESGIFDEEQQ